jgi:hypothetical protein
MCTAAIWKISRPLYDSVMLSITFAYLMKHRGLAWTSIVNVYANDAFVTLHVKRCQHGDGANISFTLSGEWQQQVSTAIGKYNSHIS